MNIAKKKNAKIFKVYFFNTPRFLEIPISVNLTVAEVIRQIIDCYMEDESVDHSLMKYPGYIDAYELRMLDDEDDYLPDFSIPSLEKNRVFASLGLSRGIAFVENAQFTPPEESEKKNNIIERYVTQRNKILVRIHIREDNFRTSLGVDPNNLVKDLYPLLSTRIKKINEKYYEFRLYKSDIERKYDPREILDAHIPLKNLTTSGLLELEVLKKKFADDPIEESKSAKNGLFGDIDINTLHEHLRYEENEIILYNEVTASHFEEFEVIKLKNKGKRHKRYLGIDGFKIYNLYKRLQDQNIDITKVFGSVFYSKMAPKHRERLIKDVIDAKIIYGSHFAIETRREDGTHKIIEYEANDAKSANQIVSKIKYLK